MVQAAAATETGAPSHGLRSPGVANALWGAHCGKSARWVLRGGTGTRDLSRPVPTHQSPPPDDENDKRRFGYSRDRRSDCVQVIIALVVTPEGLPLAYEVMPGNTADNTTLRGFLERIERQYGKAQRIWLMDRGVPTEAVLAEMRDRKSVV